ncbi:endo-1,4-beta-xylanase [Spirochaeta lutea]|uniref:endo-1,4-beta-xylanase n=1 Tax=Spirochaeta lutea TaxID=1480694 RepID=UPI000A470DB2|nr:endo-1,4-beta-xylanase [Spirochaeta lutea]
MTNQTPRGGSRPKTNREHGTWLRACRKPRGVAPCPVAQVWVVFGVILLLASSMMGCATQEASPSASQAGSGGLNGVFSEHFTIGGAVNSSTVLGSRELIVKHFGSLTAENEMKPMVIHPRMGSWIPYGADEIANLAREHGMGMRGHTLVWHQQTPGWFFSSMGAQASPEVLLERLEDHFTRMQDRYGDVVYAWDVVNEAISDAPGEFLRPSPYLEILGEDYIEEAFRLAKRIMPDAKLYYNDYSVLDPAKQDKIYTLLSGLLEKGVPIDGIGFQGHWNIYFPDSRTLERGIQRFAALGLDVQITELDVSVYRHEDRATRLKEPTPEILELQADRYREIFQTLVNNSQYVSNVTFWGVADDKTWLDNFPVSGRKNWPLLFAEDHSPKPAYYAVVEAAGGNP